MAFGFGSASVAAPGQAPNGRSVPQAPPSLRALPFLGRLGDHTEMAARGLLLIVFAMLLVGVVGLVVAITSRSRWNRYRHHAPFQ